MPGMDNVHWTSDIYREPNYTPFTDCQPKRTKISTIYCNYFICFDSFILQHSYSSCYAE